LNQWVIRYHDRKYRPHSTNAEQIAVFDERRPRQILMSVRTVTAPYASVLPVKAKLYAAGDNLDKRRIGGIAFRCQRYRKARPPGPPQR
jgi:hypothetical protein